MHDLLKLAIQFGKLVIDTFLDTFVDVPVGDKTMSGMGGSEEGAIGTERVIALCAEVG